MAVLNIRVEDRIRDQLKELADAEGITLSEYVRDLVMAAVVPVYEPPVKHGDEPAPETMRIAERQVLSLLHRILAHVLPEDAADDDAACHLERARVIERGFTGEYWQEVAGFHTELSRRDCDRVLDILDMFRAITYSIKELEQQGATVSEELSRRLEFQGFDHNDGLEGHMARYVKYLMSDGRWTELQPQLKRHDDGNSHSRVLDTYKRMLAEYRRIKDSRGRGFGLDDYLMSMDELEQIVAARTQPSNRG